MRGNGKEYAVALFSIALESEQHAQIYDDMEYLKELVNDNPEYIDYLVNSSIPKSERVNNLREVFEGRVCDPVFAFLNVLLEHRDSNVLLSAIDEFRSLYEDYMNVADAVVTSVVELTDEQKKKLISKLSLVTGRRIRATYVIDSSLIGGLSVTVDGKLYDGSIKKNLNILKEQIKNYKNRIDMGEVGTVVMVGDGIASVYGIRNCMSTELLEFEDGSVGLAQNLEEETVSVAILSDNSDIREGTKVKRTGKVLSVPVGEGFLGRVVNPLGEPIDGKGPIPHAGYKPVEAEAPGIIERKSVSVPLQTGIKAIDSMIPIGRGQRELIIGDRQTGKTQIALDTILNQKDQDVICIYVAIGQKASSVVALASELLREGALSYTIIVSATAAESAPIQYIAPYSGCAMAEYFREQGKDVLIIYDDLSKHAVAYRALSLLIRRPPGREAYPGDVFYLHSRLLERAACVAPEFGGGSITALPIVETQAGDVSAYIPTNVISIMDGQIFLESELFHSGIIPAINPGISVSRVGGSAQVKAMKKVSGELKLLYSQYRELQEFSQFGSDLDSDTKARLHLGERIVKVLGQDRNSPVEVGAQVAIIYAVINGYLNGIALDKVQEFENKLYENLNMDHKDWMRRIRSGSWEKDDEEELKKLLKEMTE